ncbi:hypothetical protein SD70_01765 [Gordoniibacillus kamchatkensis]|uniref:Response regulatory domain-containing protein n=1 Tax=Gordoniibacillus kamchatkensis TaxID=1590651 RepID=A0ABR5AN28_9BACL|nr:response regulator [Paenibacillus sp. VKM B-2647]KIL42278.1 hypothetical protein SD70_01765 [Paenibacillus sp. VKM B-2647]
MLKVMLVEDEIIVRLGIRSVIPWEQHGFQYVGDASDGREALAVIERENPDIVLTDIIMPNMDGLELIEAVKCKFPNIHIIVLSSHDEYDYVRRAMKLGADDYMLKASLEPQQLLQILSEIAFRIAEERKSGDSGPQVAAGDSAGQSFARIVRKLLGNETGTDAGLSRDEENMAKEILHAYNYLMTVRLHAYGQHHKPASGDVTLLHLLDMHLQKWTNGLYVTMHEREWLLLLPFDVPKNSEILLSIGQDLITAAKRVIDASISIGVSLNFTAISELRTIYRQTRTALQQYFIHGTEQTYLSLPQNVTRQDHGFTLLSGEEEKKLMRELERVDEAAIQEAVMAVLSA